MKIYLLSLCVRYRTEYFNCLFDNKSIRNNIVYVKSYHVDDNVFLTIEIETISINFYKFKNKI